MESLLAALEAYRAAGGEGLIFVNDDGLQLLNKTERRALQSPAAMHLITDMRDPCIRVKATHAEGWHWSLSRRSFRVCTQWF